MKITRRDGVVIDVPTLHHAELHDRVDEDIRKAAARFLYENSDHFSIQKRDHSFRFDLKAAMLSMQEAIGALWCAEEHFHPSILPGQMAHDSLMIERAALAVAKLLNLEWTPYKYDKSGQITNSNHPNARMAEEIVRVVLHEAFRTRHNWPNSPFSTIIDESGEQQSQSPEVDGPIGS